MSLLLETIQGKPLLEIWWVLIHDDNMHLVAMRTGEGSSCVRRFHRTNLSQALNVIQDHLLGRSFDMLIRLRLSFSIDDWGSTFNSGDVWCHRRSWIWCEFIAVVNLCLEMWTCELPVYHTIINLLRPLWCHVGRWHQVFHPRGGQSFLVVTASGQAVVLPRPPSQ